MHITLRQLRAFATVAQLGSFVEASRTLHLTQSALSIVVRELEESLGLRLLDRTTRRVGLSSAGVQYYPYVERILADLRSAEMCAHALRNQKEGVVRIATTQLITGTILPAALHRYREQYPEVRVEPVGDSVDDILPSLQAGHADIAITLELPVSADIEARPLFKSRSLLFCHPAHPLARRKSIRWAEIQQEPLILVGKDAYSRFRTLIPEDVTLNVTHEVASTNTAFALVASGYGMAACAGYAQPLAAVHGLRAMAPTQPEIIRRYMVYTSAARAYLPVVKQCRDFLVDHFQNALQPGCIEEGMRPTRSRRAV